MPFLIGNPGEGESGATPGRASLGGKMSVEIVGERCVGCETCSHVCNQNAVKMMPDSRGFLYPAIDREACNQCNACSNHCPVLNENTGGGFNPYEEKVYAAWSKDRDLLQRSSSGGMFFEIAASILGDGGLVCGAVYREDYYGVRHIVADSLDDVRRMQGSKYSQSAMEDCFPKLREALEAGRRVLFSGTPCQVAACYRFLRKKYDNFYTVSLICHGPIAPKILEEYIKSLEKKHQASICNFTMRYKKDGKTLPLYYRAEFSDGTTEINPFYSSLYGEIFASNLVMRQSCYECQFKEQPYVGDIIIGDFKGIEYTKLPHNKKGTSAVIINSDKGRKLWESLSDRIESWESDIEVVKKYNQRIRSSVPMPDQGKVKLFWEKLLDEGINGVYPLVHREYTPYQKMKNSLKAFLVHNLGLARRRRK